MNQNKHITQCSVMTPWYAWGTFFALWFLYSVLSGWLYARFGIPEDHFLGYTIGVIICGVIVMLVHRFLLEGDIILTDRGVQIRSRIRRSCAWKNCAQVIAMRYDRDRILVLLRSGGSPMKSGEGSFLFFLRNPGKVIFLPDDKFTRAFVAAHYGALDLDLTGRK